MKSKGQMFNIDLLISLTLFIFCIGVLIGFAQIKNYQIKDNLDRRILEEHAKAAAIVLASGAFTGVVMQSTNLPYTVREYDMIDTNLKNGRIDKNNLGLQDYNVSLIITTLDCNPSNNCSQVILKQKRYIDENSFSTLRIEIPVALQSYQRENMLYSTFWPCLKDYLYRDQNCNLSFDEETKIYLGVGFK